MSGTLKVTTLQDGASATANLTFDTSGNTTAGGTVAMASSFKRNRIINGNMLIDQRNAGASVTATDGGYTLDRWAAISYASASKFSVQQNAGSVTPPTGFTNYLGCTSLSAYSVGATDIYGLYQRIEGFNVADLQWGTANAKTVTLSFVVYSSLTGTFGGAINNSAQNRSYPFSYSIPSANTWTTISVTIPGDTSGTWLTTTGIGIQVSFGIGVGTTRSGTAGAWAGATYYSATGAVSVVGTNGATFYITGVQLEVGTKATPYEMQIYSDQLVQCQRYYQQLRPEMASSSSVDYYYSNAVAGEVRLPLTVSMRTSPTASAVTQTNGAISTYSGALRMYTTASGEVYFKTLSAEL